MAEELIQDHHRSLVDARIGILFRDEAPKSRGRRTLGKAQKVADNWKPLLKQDLDFIIWLAADVWNDELSEDQKRALLDHELHHCYLDEKLRPRLRGHDVEEFLTIIHRHGLWKPDLERLGDVVQRLQLPLSMRGMDGQVVAVEPEAAPFTVELSKVTLE